jgi:uncharacterized protein (DUF1684 family)
MQIEVAKRGGRDIVRPRHPDTWLRLKFAGTPAYLPDPRWVITGCYLPFRQPRPVTVDMAVDGLRHAYDAPGQVEFELAGRPARCRRRGTGCRWRSRPGREPRTSAADSPGTGR